MFTITGYPWYDVIRTGAGVISAALAGLLLVHALRPLMILASSDGRVTYLFDMQTSLPLGTATWMITDILIDLVGNAVFYRELMGARQSVHESRITE